MLAFPACDCSLVSTVVPPLVPSWAGERADGQPALMHKHAPALTLPRRLAQIHPGFTDFGDGTNTMHTTTGVVTVSILTAALMAQPAAGSR